MNLIIYLIAFLEGFTTLSVEIVALRQFTPIIGSNSISTSIILGVILLALSAGYYRGGIIADRETTIQGKLLQNLILSSIYYACISFVFDSFLLQSLLQYSGNYFFSILFSSIILFFIPVFLASQTIPLLSSLLSGSGKTENIGKLLFYSTLGSFLGSVGTSTVLFPLLGADKTAFVSPLFLVICSILLSCFFLKQKLYLIISCVLFILYFFSIMLSFTKVDGLLYEKSNSYHDIQVVDDYDLGQRFFFLNGAYASGITIDSKESSFGYIQELRRQIEKDKPTNILVIGAAGFSFPQEISSYDFIKNIDVIDVDGSLKNIAEQYFLQEKLSDKIQFFPEPSRYFLTHTQEKYDFILVDAYTGHSLPSQVATLEFFQQLSQLSDNIYLNLILTSDLSTQLGKNIMTTLQVVFPNIYYKNASLFDYGGSVNVLVTNKKNEGYRLNSIDSGQIYTDNKNSIEYDKFLFEQEGYR